MSIALTCSTLGQDISHGPFYYIIKEKCKEKVFWGKPLQSSRWLQARSEHAWKHKQSPPLWNIGVKIRKSDHRSKKTRSSKKENQNCVKLKSGWWKEIQNQNNITINYHELSVGVQSSECIVAGQSLVGALHNLCEVRGTMETIRKPKKTKSNVAHRCRTLWQLCCKGRWDCDKVETARAVVNWHLLPLPQIASVAIALVAELVQCEPTVHQHAWLQGTERAQLPHDTPMRAWLGPYITKFNFLLFWDRQSVDPKTEKRRQGSAISSSYLKSPWGSCVPRGDEIVTKLNSFDP